VIYKFWGFRIPTDLLLRLKVQAAKHRISMSAIAVGAITDAVEQIEASPSQSSKEVQNAV
jgi:plasmid stability protein